MHIKSPAHNYSTSQFLSVPLHWFISADLQHSEWYYEFVSSAIIILYSHAHALYSLLSGLLVPALFK